MQVAKKNTGRGLKIDVEITGKVITNASAVNAKKHFETHIVYWKMKSRQVEQYLLLWLL